MRSPGAPLLLLAVVGMAVLFSYATIKPALFLMILSGAALIGFYRCTTDATRRAMGQAPLFVALALPFCAWLLPNVWLLYGAVFGMMFLLPARPGAVAPIYLFALLLLPGLDLTLSAGTLKLFEFGVHDAMAVGAALRLASRPGRARIPLALDVPLIGVLLLLVTAVARDTSVTNFIRVLVNGILDCALPYYIVSRSIRSTDDLRLCVAHLTAAACILSIILLYEARTSWPMYHSLYDHYDISMTLMVKSRGGVLRAGGPFLESTSMAMVLVSCILATWIDRPAFRSNIHHMLVLALLFAGLTAPQSRGAWVGLLLGMAVADLYRRRPGAAIRRMAIIATVGAALVAIAPMSPYLTETLGLSGGSASTVDYRQRLFDRGMQEFWKSPVTGYSSPQILVHLADLRQGEGIVDFVNTYIYFALISGVVGLGVFLGAFLFHLSRLWRCRHGLSARDSDIDVLALVFAGLVMPMQMLIFTSFGGRPEVFVFVFFAFSAAIVSSRQPVRPPARANLLVQTNGSRTALAP